MLTLVPASISPTVFAFWTVVVPDVAPVAQQVLAAAAAVVPSLEDVITLLEEDEKNAKMTK